MKLIVYQVRSTALNYRLVFTNSHVKKILANAGCFGYAGTAIRKYTEFLPEERKAAQGADKRSHMHPHLRLEY